FQMLAESIVDEVESAAGEVAGLGLIPARIVFGVQKVLARPVGVAFGRLPVSGYEIHHGRLAWLDPAVGPLLTLPGGGREGVRPTEWTAVRPTWRARARPWHPRGGNRVNGVNNSAA